MSFRGKIALPIETDIKSISKNLLFFSADIIECGGFISSLNFLLSVKVGMTNEVKTFQTKYKDYISLTYNEIPFKTAEKIYNEYLSLLESNN